MHVPQSPPREPPVTDYPTWNDVAFAYLVVLAFPALLWFATHPMIGGATVLGLLSLRLAFRRNWTSLEYARKQCCLVLQVGERVQITLSRSPMKG